MSINIWAENRPVKSHLSCVLSNVNELVEVQLGIKAVVETLLKYKEGSGKELDVAANASAINALNRTIQVLATDIELLCENIGDAFEEMGSKIKGLEQLKLNGEDLEVGRQGETVSLTAPCEKLGEQDLKVYLSDSAFAVKYLGDVLRRANDGMADFEALNNYHWAAIGIAIEHLSGEFYSSNLLETV